MIPEQGTGISQCCKVHSFPAHGLTHSGPGSFHSTALLIFHQAFIKMSGIEILYGCVMLFDLMTVPWNNNLSYSLVTSKSGVIVYVYMWHYKKTVSFTLKFLVGACFFGVSTLWHATEVIWKFNLFVFIVSNFVLLLLRPLCEIVIL